MKELGAKKGWLSRNTAVTAGWRRIWSPLCLILDSVIMFSGNHCRSDCNSDSLWPSRIYLTCWILKTVKQLDRFRTQVWNEKEDIRPSDWELVHLMIPQGISESYHWLSGLKTGLCSCRRRLRTRGRCLWHQESPTATTQAVMEIARDGPMFQETSARACRAARSPPWCLTMVQDVLP